MLNKILFSLMMIGFLGACSSTPKEAPIPIPIQVERTPLFLPTAGPVEQYPFQWYVLTPENAKEKIEALMKETGSPVALSLSLDGFTSLNLSIAELRRFIEDQKAVIEAYKTYYKTQE